MRNSLKIIIFSYMFCTKGSNKYIADVPIFTVVIHGKTRSYFLHKVAYAIFRNLFEQKMVVIGHETICTDGDKG